MLQYFLSNPAMPAIVWHVQRQNHPLFKLNPEIILLSRYAPNCVFGFQFWIPPRPGCPCVVQYVQRNPRNQFINSEFWLECLRAVPTSPNLQVTRPTKLFPIYFKTYYLWRNSPLPDTLSPPVPFFLISKFPWFPLFYLESGSGQVAAQLSAWNLIYCLFMDI